MTGVTGWCRANGCSHDGIVAIGTNHDRHRHWRPGPESTPDGG
jgi:hypothetical protein